MVAEIIGIAFFIAVVAFVVSSCIGAILDSIPRKSGRLVVDEETGKVVERQGDES